MAYSDGNRRSWEIDLSTRAGAQSAANTGAIACFVFCGMAVLGMILLGGEAGYGTPDGIAVMIGAGLEAVVGLVAGLRLRAGKGAYWGIAVAALAAIELIAKIAALSIMGIVLVGLILIWVVQGIRGAFALKKEPRFEDDDVEVFN